MMDKMREEFVAWFKSFADIDVLFDDNGQAFTIDQPITYGDKIVNTTVDAAWMSWKASHAAQCVELPDSERSVDCGYVLYRSDVEEALDAAGIRYK